MSNRGDRGRGRGRGRGRAAKVESVPGLSQSSVVPPAGRGRSTVRPPGPQQPALQQQQPPQQPQQTQQPQQPAPPQAQAQAQAQALPRDTQAVVPAGEPQEPHTPRVYGGDIRTKPEHITDKSGTSGRQVALYSNYFRVVRRPDAAMYQYHVDFNPPLDSKCLRKALIREKEDLIGTVRAFDGMVLYLPIKLAQNPVAYVARLKDGTDVNVTIKITKELAPDDPSCLQLINVLFRRVMEQVELQEIGRMRNFYNPKQAIPIRDYNIELWPGFVTSIARYEEDVMLCIEVSHKVLRTDTVLDSIGRVMANVRSNAKNVIARQILGNIVITRYNNKTYRIDDIAYDKNPTDTFETKTGPVSFVDYYMKSYNIKITDMGQPLLVSMPKKRDQRRGFDGPILLVPELCFCTGLSDDLRQDFKVMKAVGQYMFASPADKRKTLEGFVSTISRKPEAKKVLAEWNLEFDQSLTKVTGRLLPPEKLFQSDPARTYSYRSENTDWTRDMRSTTLKNPINLKECLFIYPSSEQQKAKEFWDTMRRAIAQMGMVIPDTPQIVAIPDDRCDTYVNALKKNIHPNLQLVIVILKRNSKDRYDAVKKVCCLEKPVPSQCIVSRTLNKNLMSVCTKIALQINCKLGGELWAVEIPLKKTMVIGIDTYHDSSQKGRSAVGFVASTNPSLTRYFCQSFFQAPGMELAAGLNRVISGAMQQFQKMNGNELPDRVMVYRDGVGEGQLSQVVEFEIPQFTQAFKEAAPGYKPKFTFIVVTKRINTRFMASTGNGPVANPLAGTIVDNVVTRNQWYDFFLISQSVRQGTVAPAHFNVIYDDSGLKPDHIQRLSYKLCHLYYNWSGTVRVPAPCQYAHKLAYLIGESIHKEPSMALANHLYFL